MIGRTLGQAIRDWLQPFGVKTLYIEPGNLWENGHAESINGNLREYQPTWEVV